MKDRHYSLLGAALTAFALCAVLLSAVAVSATTGTMQITTDTTLTEDHSGPIDVIADNVTLDCDGHTVTGSGTGHGIDVDYRTGVTVRNCTVSGFEMGIDLQTSNGNVVSGNTVTANSSDGIHLSVSDNNTVTGNAARDNDGNGFSLNGGSTGNTFTGNTAIDNGLDGFLSWESWGNTFATNAASGNGGAGLSLVSSDLNKIINFTATGNSGQGISFYLSDSNEAADSRVTGNGEGIVLTGDPGIESKYNTLRNNVATNNRGADTGRGFLLQHAMHNTLIGNTASGNGDCGFCGIGTSNTLTSNEAHGNGGWGFASAPGVNTYSKNYCTGNEAGNSTPSGSCQEEQVGLVNTASGEWHLRHSDNDLTTFYYGNPGDVPFMGDWNCDTVATPGLFRTSDAFAYLRNSNTQGIADIRFFFGNPSDVPLAGDFNGDGCDTLSIYRPSEARFYIMNKLGENEGGLGAAEYSFLFGNPGDKPVVGDWDGDGVDEIGLHRETTGFFYYRNTLTTGIADGQFYFGDPGDRFIAGDWGVVDGAETPAMYRPSNTTFYFRHTLTQGVADSQFTWTGAGPGWIPIAGGFAD